MELLPEEIKQEILRYLEPSSLSRLSQGSRRCQDLAIPHLYKRIDIVVDSFEITTASLKAMAAFSLSNKRRFLKHVNVLSGRPINIYQPIVEPLCIALATLFCEDSYNILKSFSWNLYLAKKMEVGFLRLLPRNLSTLRLENSGLDPSVHFPTLNELRCNQLLSMKDLEWAQWHIERGSLGKLALAIRESKGDFGYVTPPKCLTFLFASSKGATSLSSLGLGNIDLVDWPFHEMRRLEVLSLQRCLHLETALAKFLHRSHPHIVLRELALTVVHERVELIGFLNRLSEITALTDLHLLTAGCEYTFPIASVLLFKKSLQNLTLESRGKAMQPATIKPYTIEEFYTTLSACSKLKTLGMPITIDRTSRYMWRILGPHCPLTHLHQRCHRDNSDPKRFAKGKVDAKHLSRALLPALPDSLIVTVGDETDTFSWRISRNGPAERRRFAHMEYIPKGNDVLGRTWTWTEEY